MNERPDIEFFDDVFEPRFCRYLLTDAEDKLARGREFARTSLQWHPAVVRSSQPVLVRDYDENISAIILGQLSKRGIISGDAFDVMNYAWLRLSYLPWHNDEIYSVSVTVYLNIYWDSDWGGLFLYEDQNGLIHGRAPKFNTAVRNNSKVRHSISMIAPDAVTPRLTLQIFGRGQT